MIWTIRLITSHFTTPRATSSKGPSAQLLESLAGRIAAFALEDERVQSAWVRIRKPHVAVPGALDYLGIEITRTRDDDDEDDED